MSLTSEIKVELEQPENGDLLIRFNSETMDDIIVRKAGVPREKMGGEARMLLAASLAECMFSTFTFLLGWANVKHRGLRAEATVSTEKDERGQLCVGSVDVKIEVEAPEDEETMKRLRRVENLFKRGCLMSRSLERGIKVSYTIDMKGLHSQSAHNNG